MAALALVALVVFGALNEGGRQSLVVGLADPVLALDHFVVLIGVGLWAGKLGASAHWRLPAAFLIGALQASCSRPVSRRSLSLRPWSTSWS